MNILFIIFSINFASTRPILSNCEKFGEDGLCIKCNINFKMDKDRRHCISSIFSNGAYCKNCIVCRYGACKECESGYDLIGAQCIQPSCEKFNNCSQCDKTQCLSCNIGHFMNENVCEKEYTPSSLTYDLIIIILCPMLFALVTLALFLYCFLKYRNNKEKTKNLTRGKSISKLQDNCNEKHQQINSSIIAPQMNISFNAINAINNSIISLNRLPSSIYLSRVIDKSIVNADNNSSYQNPKQDNKSRFKPISKGGIKCLFCNSKSIYVVLDCGCELCSKHYLEMIKVPMNTCPVHDKVIDNYYIKQKKLKDTFIETMRVDDSLLCSKCNKETGTISLNCGCSSMVCSTCFNELDSVVNYYYCPMCQGVGNK